jgi:tRNA dimethylallyltransferase
MKKRQKILVLVGPTSSGKSALAVELARKFDGEVISADSRQVYRGLDIGTGKITKREMKGVPHHLLDVASPKKQFTAKDFAEKARAAIQGIAARGKLPIIAGGTGFYIDALLGRITLPDVPADKKLRAALEKKSAAQLFTMLKKKDPRRAKIIDRHNKVRLIRALEIVAAIGKVPCAAKKLSAYEVLWIGIAPSKKELHEKITIRLFVRIRLGMVAEAKRLHALGLSYKRMRELGLEYRALADLLEGNISRAEMVELLDRDIRRYAKRQLTYWKRNKDIVWFEPSKKSGIETTVKNWLKS